MEALVIRIKPSQRLPDNAAWTNRFNVRSQSGTRLYTIAQSKSGRWWGCSCPGFISHRHCKHLNTLGLPGGSKPFEARLG